MLNFLIEVNRYISLRNQTNIKFHSSDIYLVFVFLPDVEADNSDLTKMIWLSYRTYLDPHKLFTKHILHKGD